MTDDEKEILSAVVNSLQVIVAVSSSLVRELHASAEHSVDWTQRHVGAVKRSSGYAKERDGGTRDFLRRLAGCGGPLAAERPVTPHGEVRGLWVVDAELAPRIRLVRNLSMTMRHRGRSNESGAEVDHCGGRVLAGTENQGVL